MKKKRNPTKTKPTKTKPTKTGGGGGRRASYAIMIYLSAPSFQQSSEHFREVGKSDPILNNNWDKEVKWLLQGVSVLPMLKLGANAHASFPALFLKPLEETGGGLSKAQNVYFLMSLLLMWPDSSCWWFPFYYGRYRGLVLKR